MTNCATFPASLNFEHMAAGSPLFEDISDDKSACLKGGAVSNFNGRVPRIGSETFPQAYETTSQFSDISIRMFENPYDVKVKAVRVDGGDVGPGVTIPANSRKVYTVAKNVLDRTRFKLDFEGPTTLNYFDISGRITY